LVIIPLEGLVDFNEEIKRLEKLVEKSQKDIQILNQKLSNPNFLQNADPEVVEADRVLLKQTQDRMEDLRSSLERFRAC
jgi:valyl-tRNA synthetase